MNKNNNLEKYADLIVHSGINLEKNQILHIRADIESFPLVRLVAKSAFLKGALDVIVTYDDDEFSLIRYQNAPKEAFENVPSYVVSKFETLAKENAAFLRITSSDPYIFSEVSPETLSASSKANNLALKVFYDYQMNDKITWCVAGYPSIKWAKRVFPNINENEAKELLLEYILKSSHADGNDPNKDWLDHVKCLQDISSKLNSMNIVSLYYSSSTANLNVELPKNHIWLSAKSVNSTNGRLFSANIPTEEVFTLPKKDGVNGTIFSTLPLNYNGNLIEDIKFTFKDGKIVEATSKTCENILKDAINLDEGACYLGEVAIVPFSSNISKLNTLFYNTLYDENASCHFAFGACYPTTLKNSENFTEKDILKNGGNNSLTHVDFMVGSSDLNIVATLEDGSKIDILKNGDYVI